ncbi:MAG TPA: VWA domain-containing protein, partial [Herpetosiphonaceae bacterium]|nr:VWA domain-containing protein [Herpetosiphonaceae bacterium]
ATATATQAPAGHPLALDLTERLQWYQAAPGANYDLVIVADYSASMRNCWDTNTSCTAGTRRIDYSAAVVRDFVDEMLVVRNKHYGGDNRLAYVTFNQKATKVVGFENDTDTALARFKNAIGDKNTPVTIGNSALSGNTNPADGLANAVSFLADARSVDKNGNPVRLAVLVLTDGVANVFHGGPGDRVTNSRTNAPYFCGKSSDDVENPLVQSTCPRQEDYPGEAISLPPIEAMVKVADDARARQAIQFYAVVLGEQFGLTPVKMHLNRITDSYFMANDPAQLYTIVTGIAVGLGQSCQELWGGSRPAPGAQVTIAGPGGEPVRTYAADAHGRVVILDLPPGDYTLTARHSAVVAPQDPARLPRDYTRMLIAGRGSSPLASLAFTMPDAPHALPAIKLVIDNVANAQCP